MLLTAQGFGPVGDHLEVLLRELQLQFICHGLHVGLGRHKRLSGGTFVEPLFIVYLFDYTKHFGDLRPGHIDSILPEQLLHLIHADRVAPVRVQLGEHLLYLPIGLDLGRALVVAILEDLILGSRAGQVAQPVHDDLAFEEAALALSQFQFRQDRVPLLSLSGTLFHLPTFSLVTRRDVVVACPQASVARLLCFRSKLRLLLLLHFVEILEGADVCLEQTVGSLACGSISGLPLLQTAHEMSAVLWIAAIPALHHC